MITTQVATVFYAETKGRRYFTLDGAASAEAWAVIGRKYPFDIEFGPDDSCNELHARLVKKIKYLYRLNKG